jgi:hypothetical protein
MLAGSAWEGCGIAPPLTFAERVFEAVVAKSDCHAARLGPAPTFANEF